MPILIVNAVVGAGRPAVLHLHGGGSVLGKSEDRLRELQEPCQYLR